MSIVEDGWARVHEKEPDGCTVRQINADRTHFGATHLHHLEPLANWMR
jgi:hypothetical protein